MTYLPTAADVSPAPPLGTVFSASNWCYHSSAIAIWLCDWRIRRLELCKH